MDGPDDPTPAGGPDDPAAVTDRRRRILELLQRFADALDELEHDWAQTAGLHRSDLAALNHLARADEPLPMGELGGRLSLSPGAITALVDRLEGRGHVVRGTDARDRRRVTVTTSSSASELAGAFFGAMAGRILATLDDFDDHELAAIERFLAVLPPAVAPRLADGPAAGGDDASERRSDDR
jgi:MarR family transcriptional regulator, organic hydroperoxide resistance regulator